MKTTIAIIAAAAALALTGCSSVPRENSDLNAARAAVEQARQNPYVTKNANVELDRAQQALSRAEKAWVDDRNVEETRHLSYLATQQARIAQATGAQAQADENLKLSAAERDRLRLDTRTREADIADAKARAAQAQAANATAEAMTAQASAQSAQASARNAQEEAQAQAQRAAALERDLRELQARNTARGIVVTIGDVLFDTGKATLQAGAQHNVQQLAAVLKQHAERRVLIEGHTDSVGSDSANLDLSQRRAEAFRQALLSQGVPADRMQVRAFGESSPVADNTTAAGRQQNRRVEILFSDDHGQFAMR